jgi:hypothetical protein
MVSFTIASRGTSSRSRRLGRLASVILALFVPASGVSAQSTSPAPSADPPNALHMMKDCTAFSGVPGGSCLITESNLPQIPVGGLLTYYGPALDNPMFASSSVVLNAGDGNTAFGWCMISNATAIGMCTFWAGSGTLTGFNAILDVTLDPDTGGFHWDGTYIFAPQD